MIVTLVALLLGHALADTVLQPGWLSRAKRDEQPRVAVAALLLHGSVHAAFVFLFTGSVLLALAELVVHPAIDAAKAGGRFGMKTDQALHFACKIAWAGLA